MKRGARRTSPLLPHETVASASQGWFAFFSEHGVEERLARGLLTAAVWLTVTKTASISASC